MTSVEASSGPIPSPEVLAKYDQVAPGTAARILDWAEAEGKHRRSIETQVVSAETEDMRHCARERLRGQWMGFTIAMTMISGGIFLACTVSPAAGAVLGTFGVASLVGVFIYGSKSARQSKEPTDQSAKK